MIGPARSDATFLADKVTQDWAQIMTRAAAMAPVNIDVLLSHSSTLAQDDSRDIIFPDRPYCAANGPQNEQARPVIAALLPDQTNRLPAAEVHILATRYAALSIEKECDVIILTHQNNAGFERFGFRVERLAGASAAAKDACIEQLRAFWGFEIVI